MVLLLVAFAVTFIVVLACAFDRRYGYALIGEYNGTVATIAAKDRPLHSRTARTQLASVAAPLCRVQPLPLRLRASKQTLRTTPSPTKAGKRGFDG